MANTLDSEALIATPFVTKINSINAFSLTNFFRTQNKEHRKIET